MSRAGGGADRAAPFVLVITADDVVANGAFAESQRAYLEPDAAAVSSLVETLRTKKIGIVAHFYMDAQVQGVLSAAAKEYEHVFISDSLVMADAAVKMVEAGCESVAVLGVDFMSENVRAILDDAGHTDAKVYRMAAEDIGCSLAEAAQDDKYYRTLPRKARRTPSTSSTSTPRRHQGERQRHHPHHHAPRPTSSRRCFRRRRRCPG